MLAPGADVLVATTFCDGLSWTPGAVKLSGSSGSVQWTAFGSSGPYGAGWNQIASTSAGDAVVSGQPDFSVRRLSGASGATLWARVFALEDSEGQGLVVDGNDDVVALGRITDAVQSTTMVIKLDGATGADAWPAPAVVAVKPRFRGIQADVQVDASSDVVALGQEDGASVVFKLSGSDGTELWRRSLAPDVPYLFDTTIDSAGDVIVLGYSTLASTVAKLAGASGGELWRFVPPPADRVYLSHMAAEGPGGSIVVVGQATDSLVVYRLDAATGALLGSNGVRSLGGPRAVAAGMNGAILISAQTPEDDPFVLGFSEWLAGARLVIRDGGANGVLRLRIKDPHVLAGVPGGPTDPSVAGATLTLRNPATTESASIALPAPGWTAKEGRPDGPPAHRYQYRDTQLADGPCSRVDIREGKLVAVSCQGLGGFSLDEASQGTLTVRLSIGTAAGSYCARFDGLDDAPGRFGGRSSAPPDGCD